MRSKLSGYGPPTVASCMELDCVLCPPQKSGHFNQPAVSAGNNIRTLSLRGNEGSVAISQVGQVQVGRPAEARHVGCYSALVDLRGATIPAVSATPLLLLLPTYISCEISPLPPLSLQFIRIYKNGVQPPWSLLRLWLQARRHPRRRAEERWWW